MNSSFRRQPVQKQVRAVDMSQANDVAKSIGKAKDAPSAKAARK